MIGFHNAYFTWSASDRVSSRSGIISPLRRNFILRAEGDVFFKRGALNLVVGPTGFGKTSLLLALLGEMHFIPNGLGAWYHLPRDKGVAYCPQEPWLLNESIRVSALLDARTAIYALILPRRQTYFWTKHSTKLGIKKVMQAPIKACTHYAKETFPVLDECALYQDLSLFKVSSLESCSIR